MLSILNIFLQALKDKEIFKRESFYFLLILFALKVNKDLRFCVNY